MTEVKHTPGPWVVEPYGDGDSLVIHSDGQTRICFMATPGSSPRAFPKIQANARLIAAAPDMSEALEPFADIDGEGDEDFPDSTPVTVRFGRSTVHSLTLGDFRRARAAHAKAEGCA